MKKRNEQGFTLIELLVVLAIIGILAALILSNLATARKKARDTKRKSDAKALSNALELWADDNKYLYPGVVDTAVADIIMKDDWTPVTPIPEVWTALKAGPGKYIKTIPLDPVSTDGSGFYYTANATSNASTYAIFVPMEAAAVDQVFCTTGDSSGLVTIVPAAGTGKKYVAADFAIGKCTGVGVLSEPQKGIHTAFLPQGIGLPILLADKREKFIL
ncbi:MAG: type II secretion system protein [bacterium]